MCDAVAGELILAHHVEDRLAAELMMEIEDGDSVSNLAPIPSTLRNISYAGDLERRLKQMERRFDERIPFRFHKLVVPPGAELWHIDAIQGEYAVRVLDGPSWQQDLFRDPNRRMSVGFNHVVSGAGAPGIGTPVTFSSHHHQYLTTIGHGSTGNLANLTGAAITVLILDSGLDPATGVQSVASANFANDKQSTDVSDGAGHGTVVASTIKAVAPAANLIVHRVLDDTGDGSEWDVLAALATHSDAQIVNLSLQFSLADRTCAVCKRQSNASRSKVFKTILQAWLDADDQRMAVAAAGNWTQTDLAYPARFGQTLAIASINSLGNLSGFTNYGILDDAGQSHATVFVVPGGEDPPAPEDIASFNGDDFRGTSFAAAYATGVVACLWEDASNLGIQTRADMIAHLLNQADTNYPKNNAGPSCAGLLRA